MPGRDRRETGWGFCSQFARLRCHLLWLSRGLRPYQIAGCSVPLVRTGKGLHFRHCLLLPPWGRGRLVGLETALIAGPRPAVLLKGDELAGVTAVAVFIG